MLLKKGTVSRDVARWQEFLKLPADGIFGERTEEKTKQWQAANGLIADGMVGPDTLKIAAAQGMKTVITTSWFPPKPKFSSPSNAEREKMFGKFDWRRKPGSSTDIQLDKKWADENIVWVTIPQLIGVEGAPKNGKIQVHKKAAKAIIGFFAEVERQGLKHLIISWAGSFYPRFIRGSQSTLSNHSWGTAFDINAPQNWLGAKPAAVGVRGSLLKLVPIANKFGFYWGGHYTSRLDGMHFELAVENLIPSEEEIDALVAALPSGTTSGGGSVNSSVTPPAAPEGDKDIIPSEADKKPADGSTEQTADQITNINQGGSSVPADFKPKEISQQAPPPAGVLKRGWTWVLGLGLIPTTGAGVIEALKGAAADGSFSFKDVMNVMKETLIFLMPYLFWIALVFIVIWGIKEALKQVSLIVNNYTLSRGDMNNVKIVPTEAKPEEPKSGWLSGIFG